MSDEPYLDLLDRTVAAEEVAEHFSPAIELTQEIVNYGTNLIVRCLRGIEGDVLDVVTLAVLAKQVVAALDGVEQMVCSGSATPGRFAGRALIEASLYIEWILKEESEKRARALYAGNLRNEIRWLRRSLPNTSEHQAFRIAMGDLYIDPLRDGGATTEEIQHRIDSIEERLQSEKFAAINAKFNHLRGSKPYDPPWHFVCGARRVRDVADQTGRLPEYTIFYSIFSETMHSRATRDHVTVMGGGQAMLHPIRGLQDLSTLISYSLSIAFRTYRVVLQHYRPDELPAFNRIYTERWRKRYQAIPQVDVEATPRPQPN